MRKLRLDEVRTVTFIELNERAEEDSWRAMSRVVAASERLERLGMGHLRFGVRTSPN